MGKYNKRIDANQKQIVAVLRQMGISVLITSAAGDGFTDTVLGWNGETFLCEIKDGSKPRSAQKLKPKQFELFQTFKGAKIILRSIADAAKFANLWKQGHPNQFAYEVF